ncbi:hypothetical protein [Desulfovibrio inopinatus]|uniref:hypothetical protein n=1 Tax=Desulfovibrio inopinatus TaxID=102109 RepID=UPI0004013686|nr:hypothetical protein [Desulfovibrio inopinatus]
MTHVQSLLGILFVPIILIGLAGCGDVTLTNDVAGDEQARSDYAECQYLATIAAARLGPDEDGIKGKERLVDECMQKKGYIVK